MSTDVGVAGPRPVGSCSVGLRPVGSAARPPLPAPGLPRRAWCEQRMGLPVSIHVRGSLAATLPPDAPDAPDLDQLVAAVYAELQAIDEQFSPYRPDSEVSRRRAGDLDAPSPLMAEVLDLCAQAKRLTGGSFDADLPGGFDPCGLVKGWAVERAVAPLQALRGHDWLVNAGGDVLLHSEPGRSWRVGIEDPTDPRRLLRALDVTSGAVATSGTARRGSHIVDPARGAPASRAVLSATVVGPSLLWADVAATAAVVKGTAALAWLSTVEGFSGLVVTGAALPFVTATQGFPARV